MTFETFEEIHAIESDPEPMDPRPNRLLAVCTTERVLVLYMEGQDLAVAADNAGNGPDLTDEFDSLPPSDGLFVWEGRMVLSDGTWEDPIPDAILSGTWRSPTPEEITAYVDGEFVWEVWRPDPDPLDEHKAQIAKLEAELADARSKTLTAQVRKQLQNEGIELDEQGVIFAAFKDLGDMHAARGEAKAKEELAETIRELEERVRYLAQFEDLYAGANTTIGMFRTEIEKLRADNEKLRKANDKLRAK